MTQRMLPTASPHNRVAATRRALRRVLIRRLVRNAGIVATLLVATLVVGATGYHVLDGLPWLDAALNAAMILTGMGPVNPISAPGAKLFAIGYALFSGIFFLTMTAVLLAPALHHFLHRFHLDLSQAAEPLPPDPREPRDRANDVHGRRLVTTSADCPLLGPSRWGYTAPPDWPQVFKNRVRRNIYGSDSAECPRIQATRRKGVGRWRTAAAWQKYYPKMKEQLAQVTKGLVDAAAPRPGMMILDLASGTGEPALSLAKKVAPTGRVTATDLSNGMLTALEANARAEGVTNVETQVCDSHNLPFFRRKLRPCHVALRRHVFCRYSRRVGGSQARPQAGWVGGISRVGRSRSWHLFRRSGDALRAATRRKTRPGWTESDAFR